MEAGTFRKAGDKIAGRYEVLEFVGKGSFAEVYRCMDATLNREVAVKLMRVTTMIKKGIDPEQVQANVTERFYREAGAVAKLQDPYTVTLFDSGADTNGDLFMVLEFIPGMTLREHIEMHGAIPHERTVNILKQALSSLREAHIHGLIHRDIKPENIMIFDTLGQTDVTRVLDFGIAKMLEDQAKALTSAGQLLGTPRYISPERVYQAALMPTSDLYSLGCVAYYMLSGEEIYADTRQAIALIKKHADPESIKLPQDLDIPPSLRTIINKMLEKDVNERYGASQQVLDDLDEHAFELELARRADKMQSGVFGHPNPNVLASAKTEVMEAIQGPMQGSISVKLDNPPGPQPELAHADNPLRDTLESPKVPSNKVETADAEENPDAPTELVSVPDEFRKPGQQVQNYSASTSTAHDPTMSDDFEDERTILHDADAPGEFEDERTVMAAPPDQDPTEVLQGAPVSAIRAEHFGSATGQAPQKAKISHLPTQPASFDPNAVLQQGFAQQNTAQQSAAGPQGSPTKQAPKTPNKPQMSKYILIAGIVGLVLLVLMGVVAFILWKFVINPS